MSVESVKGKKTSYRYRFFYTDEFGRKKRVQKGGFKTKREAKAAEAKAKLEIESSLSSTRTVDEVWNEWKEIHFSKYAQKTQIAYESAYKHISEIMGNLPINELTHAKLQHFFLELEPYSKSQINMLKVVFKHIIKHANQFGYMQGNPLEFVEGVHIKEKEEKEKYITREQFEWLVSQLDGLNALAVNIGYYTGLRISEIFGLNWKDVSQETIYVCQQAGKRKGTYSDRLKTKASKAVIYIPKPLRPILDQYRKEEGYIFADLHKETSTVQIQKVWPEFHYHRLRHTFITNVTEHCDARTAMALARHSTAAMTLEVYAHSLGKNLRKAIDLTFGE